MLKETFFHTAKHHLDLERTEFSYSIPISFDFTTLLFPELRASFIDRSKSQLKSTRANYVKSDRFFSFSHLYRRGNL